MRLADRLALSTMRHAVGALLTAGLLSAGALAVGEWWMLGRYMQAAATVRAGAGEVGGLVREVSYADKGDLQVTVQESPGPPWHQWSGENGHNRDEPEGQPEWWFADGRRWLSVPAERRDPLGEPMAEEHVSIVVSAAVWPITARVAGFGVFYGLTATLLAGILLRVVRRSVSRDLTPLREAARVAEHLAANGQAAGGCLPEAAGDDEVARFVRVVNQLLEQTETANAARRRFTSDAAHELRTPLASMRGAAEVALRHPRGPEAMAEVLREVNDGLRELGEVVESLLVLARLDEPDQPLLADREHAGAVLSGLCNLPPEVSIDVQSDDEVLHDPKLLHLALEQLAKNANTHGGGLKRASTVRVDGFVAFVFEDDGPGVADPERVFGRFYRDARPGVEGVGLGLPMVRSIARAHGGEAWLEARPGGGTRATLTVPLRHAAPNKAAAAR